MNQIFIKLEKNYNQINIETRNKRKIKILILFLQIITSRSLCQDSIDAKWQTFEEKEDKYQKMHPESILQ